ncbi:hypothetical protein MLD38_019390 [Melastoma candidum]|uniref:Uncharacterized protein n=1 Tax=Melastoma candidum TaxID=119954 RepID=A0ACB9R553_9MYRT|nr:hypothetical protein MLD38_019390 [Melastoma candidum]
MPWDDLLKEQIRHAPRIPIMRGVPWLEARLYIPIFREDPSRDSTLYSLAVLDFKSLQEQHRQELGIISRL